MVIQYNNVLTTVSQVTSVVCITLSTLHTFRVCILNRRRTIQSRRPSYCSSRPPLKTLLYVIGILSTRTKLSERWAGVVVGHGMAWHGIVGDQEGGKIEDAFVLLLLLLLHCPM